MTHSSPTRRSSDLAAGEIADIGIRQLGGLADEGGEGRWPCLDLRHVADAHAAALGERRRVRLEHPLEPLVQACGRAPGDRTSVVSGKRVSVRVDLGGRRIIKNKTVYESSSLITVSYY